MTPMRCLTASLLAAAWAVQPSAAIGDLAVGQVDTFEDGTTQNWFAGGGPLGGFPPTPPMNVATGGPAGTSDGYMSITAVGGMGPGSRLVAINTSQWAGDYVAAGVTAIEMDLINLGMNDLSIRLQFSDPIPGPASNMAFSTVPATLPSGSGWTHVVFPVGLSDLTPLLGTVNEALSGATELRLYHSAAATFPGESIVASLGVDNITAVPEPCAVMLMSAFLLILVGWRASGVSTIDD